MRAGDHREHIRPGMTQRQRQDLTAQAIRHATLGRRFPAYESRVAQRLAIIAKETLREPIKAAVSSKVCGTDGTRPDTAGGREPVREINGVPYGVISYFSRRRAAIEKRHDQLVRDYRAQHGHDPTAAVTHQLARQATLDTRQGKQPPRSLASKRAAWRADLDGQFGPGAATRLMAIVPGQPRQPAAPAPPPNLDTIAERTVTTVAHKRSTWTTWNIRAEAERQLRTSAPALDPARHRDLADAITTLATSPRYSISVEAPALLDEPPELRREDGESVFTEHAAGRYTSQAVLDAEQRLLNATRTPTVYGLAGSSAAAAIAGEGPPAPGSTTASGTW